MAFVATLSRRRSAAIDGGGRGSRLRRRLVAAGPLAAGLGIYLGTRVDLLSGADCRRLLEIPDTAPPSEPEGVATLIENELGVPPEELFAVFDRRPFDSGLLSQRHLARLPDGEPVIVELLRPELDLEPEEARPSVLVGQLIDAGDLPAAARGAAGDFALRLDLRHAAAALAELAEEEADSRWIEVSEVYRRLCSRRVRVLSAVRGLLPRSPAAVGDEVPPGEGRARRLGRIWLAMALGGGLFPLEPWGRNIAYTKAGRMTFLDGGVHRLPRASQPELRDYLAAVAARRPERAAQAFVDLLRAGGGDRRLRDRLRHTDPFRDRGWDVGGDLFARQVLAHWRTAQRLGYRLPEGVTPFYRGLFLLNHEACRLAGDSTAVRDGLREARLLLLAGELGGGVGAASWAGAFERQLGLLSGLPRKLDRVLSLAAADDRRHDREGVAEGPGDGGGEPRRQGSWPTVAACLLALTAVVLLTNHAAAAGGFGAAAEAVGGLLVLFMGGLLLWVAARPGGG